MILVSFVYSCCSSLKTQVWDLNTLCPTRMGQITERRFLCGWTNPTLIARSPVVEGTRTRVWSVWRRILAWCRTVNSVVLIASWNPSAGLAIHICVLLRKYMYTCSAKFVCIYMNCPLKRNVSHPNVGSWMRSVMVHVIDSMRTDTIFYIHVQMYLPYMYM